MSVPENVIHQHYVPRCYLRKWCDSNGQIWCKKLDDMKVFSNVVENVANEKYFYESEVLSENQVEYVYNTWIKDQIDVLKNANTNILSLFTLKDDLINFLKKEGFADGEKWLRYNFEEKMYTMIEGNIPEYVEKLVNFDQVFWENECRKIELLLMLFVQFVRTKKQQDLIENVIQKSPDYIKERASGTINVMRWIIANTLAYNSMKTGKIVRINNTSATNFITTDQPVVNICGSFKSKGDSFEFDEFELYYPLTPKNAVLLSFRTCYKDFQRIDIEDASVYNNMLLKQAKRFVFSC